MSSSSISVFSHRENRDGTIDSICLTCYATIASSHSVDDLNAHEKEHRCDPVAEMHFNQIRAVIANQARPRLKIENGRSGPAYEFGKSRK